MIAEAVLVKLISRDSASLLKNLTTWVWKPLAAIYWRKLFIYWPEKKIFIWLKLIRFCAWVQKKNQHSWKAIVRDRSRIENLTMHVKYQSLNEISRWYLSHQVLRKQFKMSHRMIPCYSLRFEVHNQRWYSSIFTW